MTAKELRDYILTQLPAEEALLRLLESSLLTYEKLKFPEEGKEVHPVILISMAAMDMGWNFAVEGEETSENIRGLCVGTNEYFKTIFKEKEDENDTGIQQDTLP